MTVIYDLLIAMPLSTRPQAGALTIVLGLSSLVTGLDFTIVYVALPDIGRDLGFSAASLQWVVSGYAIPYGGLLLLSGRLGDLLGRRLVFIGGMATFAIGSTLGGLAPNPGLLIAARVLQGIGAAALFPTTLALVHTSFGDGKTRDRALAIWAAAGAAGLSLGALGGGILTRFVGWQGVFFVNLPIVVVCLLGAARLLPARQRPTAPVGTVDISGAATGTAGIALAIFAIGQGPALGWASAPIVLSAVAAVVLLGVFVRIEATTAAPLLPFRILRNRTFATAAGVILLFGITLNTIPFVLTQFFQTVLNFSALTAGLAFLLPTAAITAGNLVGLRLNNRLGIRATLAGSILLGALGAALLAAAMTSHSTFATAIPGIVCFGLGLGVAYPAMFGAAAVDIADADSGVASAIASSALQIGSATGLAVLAIVNSWVGADSTRQGLRIGLFMFALAAVLTSLAATRLPGTRELPGPE
jgi:MFS family permease